MSKKRSCRSTLHFYEWYSRWHINTTTLVVERFDRRWSQDGRVLLRLPQEDMCQAQGIFSDFKYENDGGPGIQEIMGLLRGAYDIVAEAV